MLVKSCYEWMHSHAIFLVKNSNSSSYHQNIGFLFAKVDITIQRRSLFSLRLTGLILMCDLGNWSELPTLTATQCVSSSDLTP